MSHANSYEDLLPATDDLYHHLATQLKYLKDLPGAIAENNDNMELIYKQFDRMDEENWKLDISPNIMLRIDESEFSDSNNSKRDYNISEGFAIIGGKIKVKNGEYDEYSLNLTFLAQSDSELRGEGENRYIGAPCCWTDEIEDTGWRVAKRYHFDIDIGQNDDEPKPVTHLQSGGSFKPEHIPSHREHIDPHYCSTPLDKPRLPHPPMDPVLIIHLLVNQYRSLNSIIEDSWPGNVKTSEKQMWENYYSRINDLLRRDNDSRETVDDLFANNS